MQPSYCDRHISAASGFGLDGGPFPAASDRVLLIPPSRGSDRWACILRSPAASIIAPFGRPESPVSPRCDRPTRSGRRLPAADCWGRYGCHRLLSNRRHDLGDTASQNRTSGRKLMTNGHEIVLLLTHWPSRSEIPPTGSAAAVAAAAAATSHSQPSFVVDGSVAVT